MATEKLLTRREAAELLGMCPQTLATWGMAARFLPFVKIGKSVRYRLCDLEEAIRRNRVAPVEAGKTTDRCSDSNVAPTRTSGGKRRARKFCASK